MSYYKQKGDKITGCKEEGGGAYLKLSAITPLVYKAIKQKLHLIAPIWNVSYKTQILLDPIIISQAVRHHSTWGASEKNNE